MVSDTDIYADRDDRCLTPTPFGELERQLATVYNRLRMSTATLYRNVFKVSMFGALLLTASAAAADGTLENVPFLQNSYSFWLGGFFPEVDSHIRIDSSNGLPGDTIDFEDTLGLEDGKNVWFGGAKWWINPRHLLEFELAQLNRSGLLESVTENLDIGDYEIRVGGSIATVFDATLGRLTYGYSLINTDKSNLVLKGGLHIVKLDTVLQLSGAVFQDGVRVGDPLTVVEEGADITAPLPHFGLSYAYAFSPKLALRARGLAFAIKVSDYKGTLYDLGLDVQYWPWRRFGIGAGLRYFRATVSDESDAHLRGKFKYEYYGPVVYGVVGF